jgi:hypothetical protein
MLIEELASPGVPNLFRPYHVIPSVLIGRVFNEFRNVSHGMILSSSHIAQRWHKYFRELRRNVRVTGKLVGKGSGMTPRRDVLEGRRKRVPRSKLLALFHPLRLRVFRDVRAY